MHVFHMQQRLRAPVFNGNRLLLSAGGDGYLRAVRGSLDLCFHEDIRAVLCKVCLRCDPDSRRAVFAQRKVSGRHRDQNNVAVYSSIKRKICLLRVDFFIIGVVLRVDFFIIGVVHQNAEKIFLSFRTERSV